MVTIICLSTINAFSFSIIPRAFASSMTITSDTTITSNAVIGNGEYWNVMPGVTLTIAPSVSLDVDFNGYLRVGSNAGPALLKNNGTINVHNFANMWFGNVVNAGVLNVASGSTFMPESLTNEVSGTINVSGGFAGGGGIGPTANKGTINISSSGIYMFHGTLLNENGATINNRGEIRPYTGTLQNEGTIYNYSCGEKVGSINLDYGIFTGNAPIASDFCFVVPESPI